MTVAQADVEQPVMDVTALGRKERAPLEYGATNHGQEQVEKRNRERQSWQEQPAGRRALLRVQNAARSEDEPDEHAATVPHEYIRGGDAGKEKAREAAEQGDGKEQDGNL